MADHDSFCPEYMQGADPCPFCAVIAKVREDQQYKAEMEEIGDIIHKHQAKALRAAADAWLWGGWTDITARVKEGSVIGAAQIMGDWLRARADGISDER